MSLRLIDTAGLNEKLNENNIEQIAQKKSIEMLKQADLVLLVLDSSQANNQLDNRLLEQITGKLVLTVLNKSDLPPKFDMSKLPEVFSNSMCISAKQGTGIDNMLEKIRQTTGVAGFDLKAAVCFTERQHNLMQKLINVQSEQQASSIITELLKAKLRV